MPGFHCQAPRGNQNCRCINVLFLIQLGMIFENVSAPSTDCSPSFPYSGQVCRRELSTERISCTSNTSQDTLNVSVKNQDLSEHFLTIFLRSGLPSFHPSPECEAAFRDFICLSVLGACGANSTELATRDMCTSVRDGVCAREWLQVSAFLGPEGLPICEELPESNRHAQTCAGSC